MAQRKGETGLTVIWSLGLYGWGLWLAGKGLMAPEYNVVVPAAYKALFAMGVSYLTLAFGVAMSLSAPIPSNPSGDMIPGRLKIGWGILALCPRPSRTIRTSLAVSAALLSLYPFLGVPFGAWCGAAALLAAGPLLDKPKPDLTFSGMDMMFLGGLASVGVTALGMTNSETPAEVWRGLGVFAALTGLVAQRTRELCAGLWKNLLPGIPPPPALDLSRYEVSVERTAPERRAELPEGVEAQLVDTGSFKVDAAKMLDKLRNYQLTDPRDFLGAWLRCAAASGAGSIRLYVGTRELTLAFDGRAFSASELSQPYQALVEADGENGLRGRHFAYGLLGPYRLKPLGVNVTSRGPDGLAVMNAGQGGEALSDEELAGTVIRVRWPVWAFYWRSALLVSRAVARYGLGKASLWVDGREVPDRPEEPHWKPQAKNGWRAAVGPIGARRKVRLYVLGTFIEEISLESTGADVWLTHDDLELDISQSSVVRGKLLDEGLNLVDVQFR